MAFPNLAVVHGDSYMAVLRHPIDKRVGGPTDVGKLEGGEVGGPTPDHGRGGGCRRQWWP